MAIGLSYPRMFSFFVLKVYSLNFWTSIWLTLSLFNAMVNSCYFDNNATTETRENRYLAGKTIVSNEIMGSQMCVKECLRRNCKSINFNNDLQCTLNSNDDDSPQEGSSLHEDSEFTFINVTRWSQNELEEIASQSPDINVTQDNYVCVTLKSKKIACVKEDSRPRDCGDIYTRGGRNSGVFILYPTDGSDDFTKAYCDIDNTGGWTVFQRRQNGRTIFYRSWNEYRDGFGDPADEYWLGNQYLHQLTQGRSCQLRVEFVRRNSGTGYANYSVFAVANEDEKFRLNIGGYSGDQGDGLEQADGMNFTTYDVDQDKSDHVNCAVAHSGAWWYIGCGGSNLNGDYSVDNGNGVWWLVDMMDRTMRKTTMKFKCV